MATTKIRSSSIEDGQVSNADLSATIAVTGGQIADDAVTLAKMAGLARGSVIVGDASGDASALPLGVSTRVLTSDGSDAAWTAPAVAEGVPSGCILMWSGAISAIPSGWVICDGNNSTPNLTSRFVIHADADSGGSYDVDDTGGSTTSGAHTLTSAEMPSHTHTVIIWDGSGESTGIFRATGRGYAANEQTMATGSGGSHTHGSTIPPYFALAYIMKT